LMKTNKNGLARFLSAPTPLRISEFILIVRSAAVLHTSFNDGIATIPAGSADLWIPSSDCTSSGCSYKHNYRANASSSSKKLADNFSIRYADGSTGSGLIYNDTG
jgi:hypothetical protein